MTSERDPDDYGVTIRDRIVNYVTAMRGGVTCAELRNRFRDMAGDMVFYLEKRPNTIMLFGLSQETMDVVIGLINEKVVHLKPTSILCYMTDGAVLNMPLARKLGKNDYKKPHWLPCVLNLGPHPLAEKEAKRAAAAAKRAAKKNKS